MDSNPKYRSPEYLEIFEYYLMDKMNPSERSVFNLQLKNDSQLKQAFEEYETLIFVVEEAALKVKMDHFHTDFETKKEKVLPLNNSKRTYYVTAASIALIMGLSGLWFYNTKNQNEKLFYQYYNPDAGLPTVMGKTNNYDFYEAMVDYKRKNYAAAIEKWTKLLEQKPENDTLNYFLGSAKVANGQEKISLAYLEQVANNENSIFYNEANFYLGLVYLKIGESQKSKTFLQKSDNDEGRELLSKLNERD